MTDPKEILRVLHAACKFDMICFLPNLAIPNKKDPNQTPQFLSPETQRERATMIAGIWEKICIESGTTNTGKMYATVLEAFLAIHERYPSHMKLDVLVTGSIHLLGGVITALNAFHPADKSSRVEDEWDSGSKLENLSKF